MNNNYKQDPTLSTRRTKAYKKPEVRELDDSVTENSVVTAIQEQYLDKQHLQALFPNKVLTKEDIDDVNSVLKDESSERYNELLSLVLEHKNILDQPECPDLITYLRAVKYVGYITMGKTFQEAYLAAHSNVEKIISLHLSGNEKDKEKLKQKAMLYSKSKLVMQITKALDYPLHLVYAGYRHQAIEALRREMNKAPLPRDRINAADRLLVHLAPTLEANNAVQININNGENKSIVDSYKEALETLASRELELIHSKTLKAKDVMQITVGEKDD